VKSIFKELLIILFEVYSNMKSNNEPVKIPMTLNACNMPASREHTDGYRGCVEKGGMITRSRAFKCL